MLILPDQSSADKTEQHNKHTTRQPSPCPTLTSTAAAISTTHPTRVVHHARVRYPVATCRTTNRHGHHQQQRMAHSKTDTTGHHHHDSHREKPLTSAATAVATTHTTCIVYCTRVRNSVATYNKPTPTSETASITTHLPLDMVPVGSVI